MLSADEQAAVDAEREALHRAAPNLSMITLEQLEEWHARARLDDTARMLRQKAAPEQIQRENDPFTPAQYRRMSIVNFEEMLLAMK